MSKGLRSDSMRSPWGQIDNTETTGVSGVTWVGTASHGGFRVTVKRAREMRSCLLDLAIDYGSRYYWFEEDCNYVAVLLTWPQIDANNSVPASVRRATNIKILRHWQPKVAKRYEGR